MWGNHYNDSGTSTDKDKTGGQFLRLQVESMFPYISQCHPRTQPWLSNSGAWTFKAQQIHPARTGDSGSLCCLGWMAAYQGLSWCSECGLPCSQPFKSHCWLCLQTPWLRLTDGILLSLFNSNFSDLGRCGLTSNAWSMPHRVCLIRTHDSKPRGLRPCAPWSGHNTKWGGGRQPETNCALLAVSPEALMAAADNYVWYEM